MTALTALDQILKAAAYYFGFLFIVRFAGKRLAGQTTTFDLIILITVGVVLQTISVRDEPGHAAIFIAVVLSLHKLQTKLSFRYRWLRYLLRGKPRVLVQDGKIIDGALELEGLHREELVAGLRRCGALDFRKVKLAVLEETGHISVLFDDAV